ncbi:hypothetical protein BH20VER1_BH20VER1_17000 [soil metagenome]
MKNMPWLLLAAILTLAHVAPLLAQDAAAPMRRSPPPEGTPTATATPAPDSAATPPETPPVSPAASPAEEPRPAPEPPQTPPGQPPTTPAAGRETKKAEAATRAAPPAAAGSGRSVITEQPVRAVAPRSEWSHRATPAPGPAAGTTRRPTFDLTGFGSGGVAGQVKALERRWQRALLDRDLSVINELVAEDFVGTSSTGRTGSKSTLLNEFRRDKNEYKTAEVSGMTVRSPSPGTAVVTGIATETGVAGDGKNFRVSRRFTDTWVKRNGRWVCVASQTTALPN